MKIISNFIIQNRISKNNAGFDQSQIALKAQNCSDVFIKRQPAFCGITSYTDLFRSKILDLNEIEFHGNLFTRDDLVAGEIPKEWENAVVNKQILFDSFGKAALKLRVVAAEHSYKPDLIEEAKEILRKGFITAGVISCDENIFLDSVVPKNIDESSGHFGSVFKLTVKDKHYALKVFKTKSINRYSEHGSWQEINRAVYYTKNTPYNEINFIKFFFGSLSNHYMLSEFYDFANEPKKPDKKYLRPELAGLCFDGRNNEIGKWGKIVDFGGIKKKQDFALEKTIRDVCLDVIYSGETLKKRNGKWLKIFNSLSKKPNYYNQQLFGLAIAMIYIAEAYNPKNTNEYNLYKKSFKLITEELNKPQNNPNKTAFLNFLSNYSMRDYADKFINIDNLSEQDFALLADEAKLLRTNTQYL